MRYVVATSKHANSHSEKEVRRIEDEADIFDSWMRDVCAGNRQTPRNRAALVVWSERTTWFTINNLIIYLDVIFLFNSFSVDDDADIRYKIRSTYIDRRNLMWPKILRRPAICRTMLRNYCIAWNWTEGNVAARSSWNSVHCLFQGATNSKTHLQFGESISS